MKNDVIRVEFRPDRTWQIEVKSFDTRDPEYFGLNTWYKSVDNMPQWIQDKLMKLQIMIPPPPEHNIEGIGRRMGTNVFWVYPD
jgi:hypothetical protein